MYIITYSQSTSWYNVNDDEPKHQLLENWHGMRQSSTVPLSNIIGLKLPCWRKVDIFNIKCDCDTKHNTMTQTVR